MTIAITGATGQLGRLVVSALISRGAVPSDLVAVGRNPKKLAELASATGVRTRVADYGDPAALRTAFEGVDRLLLISGNEVGQRVEGHRNVVAAAREAGVAFIAYTSIANVEKSGMGLAAEHLATEQAVAASGIPHTYLRNGWYIENYTDQLDTQLTHGAVLSAAGDGQVSAATRADFAEAAAAVLLSDDPAEAYELGGAPFTIDEYAATVTDVTGTPVAHQALSAEAYGGALTGAGLPAPVVDMLVDSDLGLARGDLLVAGNDLAGLIGHPATPLADAVRAARA
ncbi:MAG: NAD(P)H-binding protein [Nocardioides sp.]|uniref:NAD(P)H-binding protein n=1 Tax=Nocardioides sp. TaxID=35761 RepID=UPI003F0D7D67